ncbi:MAG: hypothetical protein QF819_07235 [Gemmatimonadota bacterium]|jgi:hypothetical protein|nr:hypothetical protein [Gemmatimonadota bacterium]MDP6528452.1 hypothetical protein [Gemmatimonadota bacterium]MDP6802953.1 hypothetical protein [Gemmatimonadota bacterium]MDP7031250.1 hypothetical protein [Gemmatimonadota bacterium]
MTPNQFETKAAPPISWPALDVTPPVVSAPLAVFQIPGRPFGAPDRYLLLKEAVERGQVRVTEVGGLGSVPVVRIENQGKLPVLAMQGEGLAGAKQNRSVNTTVLAPPGVTDIPVTCVEQGRWGGARHFRVEGFEPPDLRRAKSEEIHRRRFAEEWRQAPVIEKFGADQGEVWRQVREYSLERGVRSSTGDLGAVDRDPNVRRSVEEILDGIVLSDSTRGVVVAVGSRIVGADLFESPEVFAAFRSQLLRSYAAAGVLGSNDSPPPLEHARGFLLAPCGEVPSVMPPIGLGEDARWEGPRFVASALVWDGILIQGSVFPRDSRRAGKPVGRKEPGEYPFPDIHQADEFPSRDLCPTGARRDGPGM